MKYGRYEIVKEVGRGAMGVVYQAHDPEIDRMVALKVLRADRVASNDLVHRFLKEAKAVGRLSHPNIVVVYDIGHDHDTIYIAMEFLEGTPLNDVIKQEPMSHEKIVDLGVQMAEAVSYAHQKGIVHRDIKPTNIIVTPSGQVKITDFGIARIEDPSATQQTQAGEILGTPVYMSPEQVMGKTVDGRSDLYSLGVILYELTTGRRPFTGGNLASVFRAITQDHPVAPSEHAATVKPALERLVLKSLEKHPDARFQTGKELAHALRATLKSEQTVLVPPVSRKKRTGPVMVRAVTTAVVLIVIGVTAYVLIGGKEKETAMPPPDALPEPGASALIAPADEERSKRGTVRIESIPAGAQVFVDGDFKGSSPLKAQLPLGKHEIRLSLPRYYEWEAQIQLQEEKETPLFVRLVPISDGDVGQE